MAAMVPATMHCCMQISANMLCNKSIINLEELIRLTSPPPGLISLSVLLSVLMEIVEVKS
jgi:hypothetical protein